MPKKEVEEREREEGGDTRYMLLHGVDNKERRG